MDGAEAGSSVSLMLLRKPGVVGGEMGVSERMLDMEVNPEVRGQIIGDDSQQAS